MNFLAAVVALPIRIIVSLARNPRLAIVLVLLGVVIFSGSRVLSGNSKPLPVEAKPQPYELKYPKTQYAIQTASRLYFTNNVTDSANVVKANGYWDYTKKAWVYHKTVLTLDRKHYGKVEIYQP